MIEWVISPPIRQDFPTRLWEILAAVHDRGIPNVQRTAKIRKRAYPNIFFDHHISLDRIDHRKRRKFCLRVKPNSLRVAFHLKIECSVF